MRASSFSIKKGSSHHHSYPSKSECAWLWATKGGKHQYWPQLSSQFQTAISNSSQSFMHLNAMSLCIYITWESLILIAGGIQTMIWYGHWFSSIRFPQHIKYTSMLYQNDHPALSWSQWHLEVWLEELMTWWNLRVNSPSQSVPSGTLQAFESWSLFRGGHYFQGRDEDPVEWTSWCRGRGASRLTQWMDIIESDKESYQLGHDPYRWGYLNHRESFKQITTFKTKLT